MGNALVKKDKLSTVILFLCGEKFKITPTYAQFIFGLGTPISPSFECDKSL